MRIECNAVRTEYASEVKICSEKIKPSTEPSNGLKGQKIPDFLDMAHEKLEGLQPGRK